MAFFPRELYSQGAGFTPLFRLLDDFDSYSREARPHGRHHRTHVPTFQPKFDVREVDNAFELHGELPGMDKKDVHIEFTDPQTLIIRGRIERTYRSESPAAALGDTEMTGAITEGDESAKSDVSDKKGHQATVEDEAETDATSVTAATPATTVAEVAKTEPVKEAKPVDKVKYWVSERSIGEFSRTFSFPVRVSQEEVAAKLDGGILTVVIPKAPKHEARRINIA